jgi:hypothetical protein
LARDTQRSQSRDLEPAGSVDHDLTRTKRRKRSTVNLCSKSRDSQVKSTDRRAKDQLRSSSVAGSQQSLASAASETMVNSTGLVACWNGDAPRTATYPSQSSGRLSALSLPRSTPVSFTRATPGGALRLFPASFVPQGQHFFHSEMLANHPISGYFPESQFPFVVLPNTYMLQEVFTSLSPHVPYSSGSWHTSALVRTHPTPALHPTPLPSLQSQPSVVLPTGVATSDARLGIVSSMLPPMATSSLGVIRARTLASIDNSRVLWSLAGAQAPPLPPDRQPPAPPSGRRMT